MLGGMGWQVFQLGGEAERAQLTRAQWWAIARAFRPFWREALGVLALMSCVALMGLAPPLLLRQLVDQAIPQRDGQLLAWLVAGMVLVPLASGLLGLAQTWLDERLSQGVVLSWRLQLFEKLQAQSMAYFLEHKPGDLASRLNQDVNELGDLFEDVVVTLGNNLLVLGSTMAVLAAMDWRLAALAIAVVPGFVPPAWWVGKKRQAVTKAAAQQRSELSALVSEGMGINGFMMRRIFGDLAAERARYGEAARAFGRTLQRRSLVMRGFMVMLGLAASLGPTAVYGYGGHLAMQGALSLGTIVAFVAFLPRLYGPVTALASAHVNVMAAMAVFERLFQVLEAPVAVEDAPEARHLGRAEGAIAFEGVDFAYRADQPLFQGLSFTVRPGEFVALVGPSGAGKTTVGYLLARFVDPQGGRVLLDGQDLKALSQASVQAQLGMVTQEPFLFHTTVRENLLLAKPEASQEELEAACKAARIHELIAGLPQGYATEVGERGYRFSGGERQRLAIARVLLKDAPILLLDEATSALDSLAEAAIQEALAEAMKGRTTLAIAHRLGTIAKADRILVIEGGRLVEEGPHEALIAQGGLYARLWAEQALAASAP